MEPEDILAYVRPLLRLLDPLLSAIEAPESAELLLRDLGYAPPGRVTVFNDLFGAAQALGDLIATVQRRSGSADTSAAVEALLEALRGAGTLVRQINSFPASLQQNFAGTDFLAQTDILGSIARKLIDYLVVRCLEDNYGTLYAALLISGIVRLEEVLATPTPFSVPYRRRTVNWDKVGALLLNPVSSLKDNLVAGDQFLTYPALYFLRQLAVSLGLPASIDVPDGGVLTTFNSGVDLTVRDDYGRHRILRVPLLEDPAADPTIEVYPLLDAGSGQRTGLGVGLHFGGQLQIPISDAYQMAINFGTHLDDSLGFRLNRNGNLSFINKVFAANPEDLATSAQLGARIELTPTADGPGVPLLRLGVPQGSRVQIDSGSLALGVERLDTVRLFIEADLNGGRLVLDASDADSFLTTILPKGGIDTTFAFGVGFSNVGGLYFKGSASLLIQLPIHVNLGPIEVNAVTIRVGVENGRFPVEVSSGFSARLGPLAIAVEEMGVRATFKTADARDGNLGPLDVSVAFKPPKGAGLSVDADVVKGGGYLFFDGDRGEYAGALELVFSEFLTLKAIGLITTKLPDGTRDFSLLVVITAEFGTGIELGLGFTLLGVGGLLGWNRTMRLDALVEAVRNGTTREILFPHDVVANAPRIISDLRALFPPQRGRFLIGPMARLGWGTPPLVALSLGIIIEIPGNVAILGLLRLALPSDDQPVVVLQVAFIGVVEVDKRRLYLFASLFESRALFITLDGDMGVLAAFGDDANFVISVGGFHPRFNPPPLPFPAPRRIVATLINESYARIGIDGYLAVTPNTAQFGAHAHAFFGFDSFNVEGALSFDALLQFSPFHFAIEYANSFAIKVFGLGLYSLGVSGSLEGPTPWRVRATASISLFLGSIDVNVDVTWGEARDTTLPSIAVMPLLAEELAKDANWRTLLPPGNHPLVSLRKLEPAESATVLHPVGTLRVSQRVVPLALTIDKVGNQRPNDASYFSLTVASTDLAKRADVTELFAPAQFQDLDSATKLSRPAYERYAGGIELAPAGQDLASGAMVKRVVRYDVSTIDTGYRRVRRSFATLFGGLFDHLSQGGSAARSALSELDTLRGQAIQDGVRARGEGYAVADLANNRPIQDATSFPSRGAAEEYLKSQIAVDPRLRESLHVIPNFELAA
jgi:hypothetical protein